jgi:N-acetylhexosamine 1-kinase
LHEQYPFTGTVKKYVPFGGGHINDTYLVSAEKGNFILQRVNRKVFDIPKLVSNYEILVLAIESYRRGGGEVQVPAFFRARNGACHFIDAEGFAWRMMEFIPDATAYDISTDAEVSFRAAGAMGGFQQFLNTLDTAALEDTISGFHNLPGRWEAFLQALEHAAPKDRDLAAAEMGQLQGLTELVEEYRAIVPSLPVRITHNDTKISNILFHGENYTVIDLDTVMRGLVMYDFGDMVRTFTSPAKEDEPEVSRTRFRQEHFEALTRGYLGELKKDLTGAEVESLLPGALFILFEQALRFFTDFLGGNKYYRVKYPGHNLVRTRTQLKLLSEILDQRATLESFILRTMKG